MRYRADIAIKDKKGEMEDKQVRNMIDAAYDIDGQRLRVCELLMQQLVYCNGHLLDLLDDLTLFLWMFSLS